MRVLQRLPRSSAAWHVLCRSSGSTMHTSPGAVYANNPQDENFLKSTVTATAGTVVKKFKEATGAEKAVSTNETQEPAGVMENRDASEADQPQSRYKAIADKAKEQWQGRTVVDLYPDAKKNAEATAESAKTKAAENRTPIS